MWERLAAFEMSLEINEEILGKKKIKKIIDEVWWISMAIINKICIYIHLSILLSFSQVVLINKHNIKHPIIIDQQQNSTGQNSPIKT